MSPSHCRECRVEVAAEADFCPACGAPRPALAVWNGVGFEWKSRAALGGWPLVHIAFGTDICGRPRVARGIVAVGQRAVGAVACGILAAGFVSLGVVSAGVCSLGVVAVGLAAALGVNAIAPFAVGVVACGVMAVGVSAIGWKTAVLILR